MLSFQELVLILDKSTMILEILVIVRFSSFCRFVASHQIISYPAEGAICGVLDRLIEELWKDKNKSQSGKCRSPSFESRIRSLDKKSFGLSHSSMDGQRRKSPVICHP